MTTSNAHPGQARDFGIIQGRLTVSPPGELQWFPQESWREEFSQAQTLGMRFVELIAERQFNEHNPIWTEAGRRELKEVAGNTDRALYSICTDYIIDHPMLGAECEETWQHVDRFLEAASDLNCSIAIFPLLEHSDLNAGNAGEFVPVIRQFARKAAAHGLTICLETVLSGSGLRDFLGKVGEPNVKCVYDTGNRVVIDQDLHSEIRLLEDWIGHVHIKDKNPAGENVLLGSGLVNFQKVFLALAQISYKGPLVFETTRGSDPFVTAQYNMNVCNFFAHEAARD